MTLETARNGAGLPDMAVSVRQVFGIDTDLEVPAYSRPDEHVPDIDPDYLFNRDVTLAILAGFKHNRRVMIQHGLKPVPLSEVPLEAIDDVRLDAAGVDPFYLSGDLEILSKGQVALKLPGVPEPEGFRQAILNARRAWGKPATETIGPFVPASAAEAK